MDASDKRAEKVEERQEHYIAQKVQESEEVKRGEIHRIWVRRITKTNETRLITRM